jgi:hypothetical protein
MKSHLVIGVLALLTLSVSIHAPTADAQSREGRLPNTPTVFKPLPGYASPYTHIPPAPGSAQGTYIPSMPPPLNVPDSSRPALTFAQADPCAIPGWLKDDMRTIKSVIMANVAGKNKDGFEAGEREVASMNCERKLWTYYIRSLSAAPWTKTNVGSLR